jgi:hypothetical protein
LIKKQNKRIIQSTFEGLREFLTLAGDENTRSQAFSIVGRFRSEVDIYNTVVCVGQTALY